MIKDYQLLNRMFSRSNIRKLIRQSDYYLYNECVSRYLTENEYYEVLNGEVIKQLYRILNTSYRNEYYFKNTLLNKLILGIHSLNTSVALAEVPIAKSKADFILINGKGIVYEVKSDLDSLDRLDAQIEDYYKAFGYVYIVTNEKNAFKLLKSVDKSNVGIYVLNSRGQLSKRKEAIEDFTKLDSYEMFKLLRKSEYVDLIDSVNEKQFRFNQVEHFEKYFELSQKIPKVRFQELMLDQLRKRNINNKEEFKSLNYTELSYITYFEDFNKEDYYNLNQFLNKKYGG